MARQDVERQQLHGGHLLRRKRPVAEPVYGIDDLDADRERIDVRDALPARNAGVPSAAGLRDELEDAAVLLDPVVNDHPGGGVAQKNGRAQVRTQVTTATIVYRLML